MFYIGCHLSPSAGWLAMGQTAKATNASTFQFFTRNPRGSKAKVIDPEDAAALVAFLKKKRLRPRGGARPLHHQPLLQR